MKIQSHYMFDQFLMYLIQDVTKKSSADILIFFHELSNAVAEIGMANRRNEDAGIHKKIDDFYPGTSIPFNMELKGQSRTDRRYDPITKQYIYSENEIFYCTVHVGFPNKTKYMADAELKKISEALMEQTLLGGEGIDIPNFEKPEHYAPKMYKKFMDELIGRPQEEKKSRKKKTPNLMK